MKHRVFYDWWNTSWLL